MAAKKIEIIYDINGKPIDVAIDKTINLQKQLRLLTAELRKTKEGTAEFALLSSKANDVKDNLDRVNAKSKDFFGTLSLLPGPIGSFAGQIDNAIGLLKTFSGFSLKDIRNQFKQLGGDISDIANNFSKTKDVTKETTETVDNLSGGLNNATIAAAGANRELKGTGVNLVGVKSGMKLAEDAVKNLSKTFNGQVDVLTNARGKITDILVSYTDANGQIKLLTENQIRNIAVSKTQITTTQQLAAAEVQATVATGLFAKAVNGLKVAFISLAAATGIGLLLVGLGFLIELLTDGIKFLYKMATGTLAAEKATKELTKALDDLDAAYDKSNKSLKRTTAERIALLKSQNATEEEVRKATIDGLIKERDVTSKTLGETIDIIKKLQKNRGKNDEENNKQIERALKKKKDLEETYKDQSSAIRIAELNNITENNKKVLEEDKKKREENQKILDKIIEDTKIANEQLRALRNENILSSIQQERFRQKSELEFQKEGEQRKIDLLNVSEELKGQLKEQINTKYNLKLKQLNKKFEDEDIKANEEFNNKLGEISIAAIKDETERQVAAREEKYQNDLRALERDINFIKMSEEAKNFYRKELQIAAEQDKRKIENDGLIKRLDNELKFLQIRNESVRKGTASFFDSQRELLDKAQERELAELDLTEKQKTAIKEKYARMRKDIDRQEFETYLNYVNQGLSTLSGFFQQQQQIVALQQQNEIATLQNTVANKEELAAQEDKVKEKYFYKNRNAQYAQALIGSFQSAISAYSSLAAIPVVGPALGAAAAAVALAFGFKQANLIKKQQYVSAFTMPSEQMNQGQNRPLMPNYLRNYEEGGLIGGKRHAEGGTIIEAEKGEAIMTRGAVTMFAPLLSMMNQMGGGTSFTIGAAGQARPDAPATINPSIIQATPVVKTYVVSNELTTEVERQARLKDLSTL